MITWSSVIRIVENKHWYMTCYLYWWWTPLYFNRLYQGIGLCSKLYGKISYIKVYGSCVRNLFPYPQAAQRRSSDGGPHMMRLGETVKKAQLLNTKDLVNGLRGRCGCEIWLDMTTPALKVFKAIFHNDAYSVMKNLFIYLVLSVAFSSFSGRMKWARGPDTNSCWRLPTPGARYFKLFTNFLSYGDQIHNDGCTKVCRT